jgi:DNA polymerase-1
MLERAMTARPTELPPPGSADVLYVIDLSGYVFRAYHAIAPLTSPSGEPTHAVYGTVNMLSKLVDERRPAHLAVAMDAPGRTFRDDLDARYKAHRPPAPPDLSQQMKRCEQIVEAYGIPIFQGAGLEADDYIATLVKRARESGLRVVVASADKDLMQLVDDGAVMLWDAMRDKVYGPAEVVEKFGVPPAQIRDLLALVGDTSDNVPGVPGVGPKTAAELLTRYGTLEGVFEHLDEVKKPKLKENLGLHKDDALLSQKLVTLEANAAISFDLERLVFGGAADPARLHELFTELGFQRQLKAIPTAKQTEGRYHELRTRDELAAFAARAKELGQLALAFHTTGGGPMTAELVGLSLAVAAGEAAYVPLAHRYLGAPRTLAWGDVAELLGATFADPAVAKVGHDLKEIEVLLRARGLRLGGVRFDSMLASYLQDPEESHELAAVAERYAAIAMKPLEVVAPKKRGLPQRGLEDVEVSEAVAYAAPFADVALLLEQRLTPRLADDGLLPLLRDLELPLSSVLAEMEHVGVLIDPAALDTLGAQMAIELTALEEKARATVEMPELNLGVAEAARGGLFDKLGLKATRRRRRAARPTPRRWRRSPTITRCPRSCSSTAPSRS